MLLSFSAVIAFNLSQQTSNVNSAKVMNLHA
jgi:hypothetical protein